MSSLPRERGIVGAYFFARAFGERCHRHVFCRAESLPAVLLTFEKANELIKSAQIGQENILVYPVGLEPTTSRL